MRSCATSLTSASGPFALVRRAALHSAVSLPATSLLPAPCGLSRVGPTATTISAVSESALGVAATTSEGTRSEHWSGSQPQAIGSAMAEQLQSAPATGTASEASPGVESGASTSRGSVRQLVADLVAQSLSATFPEISQLANNSQQSNSSEQSSNCQQSSSSEQLPGSTGVEPSPFRGPQGQLVKELQPLVAACNNPRFGDYQCNNAMGIWSRIKGTPAQGAFKTPNGIGQTLMQNLPKSAMVAATSIAGPGFVNVAIADEWLARRVQAVADSGSLAEWAPRLGLERAVVDFSSPNIAKEMHVGHLRSTIIGDTLARMLEYCGVEVLRRNHVGDWGTQFGMLIEFLFEQFPDWETVGEQRIGDLQVFYKAAKKKFDDDPAFKEKAQKGVVKLQGGDPVYRQAWTKICDVSRKEFDAVYQRLNVKLKEQGESFYNPFIPGALEQLVGAKLVVESDGAQCIWVEGHKVPLIVLKSDGGFNYATTDLACLWYRIHQEKAQWVIYVTDVGQAQHFDMVYKAARMVGWLPPLPPPEEKPKPQEGGKKGAEGGKKGAEGGKGKKGTEGGKGKKGEAKAEGKGGDPAANAAPNSTGEPLATATTTTTTTTTTTAAGTGRATKAATTTSVGVERTSTAAGAAPPGAAHGATAEEGAAASGAPVPTVPVVPASVPFTGDPNLRVSHVGFGLVLGEDGKRFRTRSSEVVRLVDLLDEAVGRARQGLIERGREGEWTADEIDRAAAALGYGAVKYADLKNNRTTDYVFDFDKMLDMKGNTAVYLLYAYARIRSIIRKSGKDPRKLVQEGTQLQLKHPNERALALDLCRFSEVVEAAVEDLLPNTLCEYLYNLSGTFTSFYSTCQVVGSEDEQSRLILCEGTAVVMRQCFQLLGITPLERL